MTDETKDVKDYRIVYREDPNPHVDLFLGNDEWVGSLKVYKYADGSNYSQAFGILAGYVCMRSGISRWYKHPRNWWQTIPIEGAEIFDLTQG
jgi:hypothetical protein